MHRRRFLALSSAALLPATAGCSDEFDPVESKQRLGSAEPLTVDIELDREYEYVDSSHEVRFTWSGETRPMDPWGADRASEHAADVLQHELDAANVLGAQVGLGSGSVDLAQLDDWQGAVRPTEAEFERSLGVGVVVRQSDHYERDGTRYRKPAVEFDHLVEVTPRSVGVTIRLPEYDHHAVLPVLCTRMRIRDEEAPYRDS